MITALTNGHFGCEVTRGEIIFLLLSNQWNVLGSQVDTVVYTAKGPRGLGMSKIGRRQQLCLRPANSVSRPMLTSQA
jgi:hypothetical protein